MKRLLVLIILVLLVSCAQEESFRIGWSGPLTGEAAVVGLDNLHGIELAVREINQKGGINDLPLEIIAEDDGLEPRRTLSAYAKLTGKDKSDIVISPGYAGVLSLATVTRQGQVVINSLDAGDEIAQAGEQVFGVGVYTEGLGHLLAEFLHDDLEEYMATVIYNEDDPFMFVLANAFEQRYSELGGQTLAMESYLWETRDFRAILLRIDESSPIVLLGFDEAGILVRQAHELGLDLTILGTDTFTSEGFLENAGEASQGIYFTSWDASSDKYLEFEKRFVDVHGSPPEQPLFAATGYDTILVIAQALRIAEEEGIALDEALYRVRDIRGVTGTLSMEPSGVARTAEEEIFVIEGDGVRKATPTSR